MDENEICKIVVDQAIRIHRELGPGLLESVYETVLAHELRERALSVRRQVSNHSDIGTSYSTRVSGQTSSWKTSCC
jgi:GxxExxY protein